MTFSPGNAQKGDFRAFLFVAGSGMKGRDLAAFCNLLQGFVAHV
jgi:hypothetical protein